MKTAQRAVLSGLFLLFAAVPAFGAGMTTVTWHGHAAFEIVTPAGKSIWIDPWLKNPVNPAAQEGRDPVAAVAKADYILISHGHFDHVGDSAAIAAKTGARLVATFELGTNLAKLQGYPKEQMGFDTLMIENSCAQSPASWVLPSTVTTEMPNSRGSTRCSAG